MLESDCLAGICRGFQVSPRGGDVPGYQGFIAGVVVQAAVSQKVTGSFGAGDCLGEQGPGLGRVDVRKPLEQAFSEQDVVAKLAAEAVIA